MRTSTPLRPLAGFLVAAAFAPLSGAGTIPRGDVTVQLIEAVRGLPSPLLATHAGDGSGRLFILDQTGKVWILKEGTLIERPFLDLSSGLPDLNPVYDERGLLGMAFHPDYSRNGRFFVRYSAPREGAAGEPCSEPGGFIPGCHKEVLSELSVSDDPDIADPASERVLFQVDKPQFNHNGGHIAFGPDGYLYVSLGDGGGANDGLADEPPSHGPSGSGQDLETPLGKILRIDVDGGSPFAIPPDNPFVGTDGLDTIWAYGFRNPYRFSFDRGGSRELLVADVGQNLYEELDVVERGGNHGWALREGAHCFDPFDPQEPPAECPAEGLIEPIAEYDHTEGISIIGGFVYRGDLLPELRGKYVFGDFSRDFSPAGRLFSIDLDGDRSKISELRIGDPPVPLGLYLKGFGEDEAGELYVLASTELGPAGDGGSVYRILGPAARNQVPGDCTGDGLVDISDPICLLGFLFLGTPGRLPCADGTAAHPSNRTILDWSGDGTIELSDAVGHLSWLFTGGAPHPLYTDADGDGSFDPPCKAVPLCPEAAVPCVTG